MNERKMHKFNGLQHFNCFADKYSNYVSAE